MPHQFDLPVLKHPLFCGCEYNLTVRLADSAAEAEDLRFSPFTLILYGTPEEAERGCESIDTYTDDASLSRQILIYIISIFACAVKQLKYENPVLCFDISYLVLHQYLRTRS